MIDHLGFTVSNFEKSKAFYLATLAPLGYKLLRERSKLETGGTDVAGLGNPPKADFWIRSGLAHQAHVHIAFKAKNKEEVDAFYQAAIAAGGKDNGKPGFRVHYHSEYYGAFVLDPDGHNIEAVFHGNKF